MRDYGAVSPRFWTGKTGKALRGHPEAQIIACYLMTCPGSHMIGLYSIALPTMCHETGLSSEGASKGLLKLAEEGFSEFDAATEVIWVPEMARFQIGERLKIGKKGPDKRIAGVRKELENFKGSRFFNDFIDRYGAAFNLGLTKVKLARNTAKSEAPSKPLPSQEQEQEQEQDTKKPSAPKTAPADSGQGELIPDPGKQSADQSQEVIEKACRRAIADRFHKVQTDLGGQRFDEDGKFRTGIVAFAKKCNHDTTEALRLLDVFVDRMATDAHYAKKFEPTFVASEVHALRRPLTEKKPWPASTARPGAHVAVQPEQPGIPGRKYLTGGST